MFIIKNRIIKTTKNNYLIELNNISKNYKTYKVEIDGEKVQTWEDYINIIQDMFKFPSSCVGSIDRYLDWIRDLSWLDKEEIIEAYVIVIKNYDIFLAENIELKNSIITDFVDCILPFWEEEVKQVVLGGKTKIFCVYLLDSYD